MIHIIEEHFRIIIMVHSITGPMLEVMNVTIKKQFMQEHIVRPMRLLIQIWGSELHLMRDGKE